MEVKKDPLYQSMIDHSNQWAAKRKMFYKNRKIKITGERLAAELRVAKILGYLDSAEHILKAITMNKDWTKEDIEAELHLYLQNLSNIAEEYMGQEKSIDLNFILEQYGYFDNKIEK